MNETIARLLNPDAAPAAEPSELVVTFRELIAASPFDRPGLGGLLEAIHDAARELADLSYRDGDAAVWARLGELPAFAPEFHAWADAVLDVTPATAVPQADGDPGPVEEGETARARAIRETEEADSLGSVGMIAEPENLENFEAAEEELPDVEVEVDVGPEETARARAIRQAEEAAVEPDPVELPEGTDVPFPTASADASAGSSSGGASVDVSGGSPVELALAALDRRVMQMADQLRRVDQVTADSLGGIRDRLRKLEGRPGVPPVTEPPAPTDGGPIALVEEEPEAEPAAEDAETADSGDPEPAGPETTP